MMIYYKMIDGLWSDIDDWRSKKAMTVIAKWIIS